MAHQLAFINGKASIAYVGESPWHGYGQRLEPGASFEQWLEESGMGFDVLSEPVMFYDQEIDQVIEFPDRHVLFRSDNRHPLSIVSSQFKVIPPKEILKAQFEVCDAIGATMETAGVLFDGKRFWSMSKLGDTTSIGKGDDMKSYVLIATAVDGTLATVVRRTMVRVVCNNTLTMAVDGVPLEMKVPHSAKFNFDEIRQRLGIDTAAETEMLAQMHEMTKVRLSNKEAIEYFTKVLTKDRAKVVAETEVMNDLITATPAGDAMDDLLSGRLSGSSKELPEFAAAKLVAGSDGKTIQVVYDLYQGKGMGAELSTSHNTLWGAVNAVTEYQDHHRGAKTMDSRINKAWFGDGNNIKNAAYADALEIIASLGS